MPKSELDELARKYPHMFSTAQQMKFEDTVSQMDKSINNQTKGFQSLSKALNNLQENVFSADTRGKSKLAGKSINEFEQVLKDTFEKDQVTAEEKDQMKMVVSELRSMNRNIQKNELSMGKALSESLKSNLPSLAGILGTIGLDNPAFLFLGSLVQNLWDQRKQQKQEQDALFKEHHKEMLKADLENAGLIQSEIEQSDSKETPVEQKADYQDNKEEEFQSGLLDIQTKLLEIIADETKTGAETQAELTELNNEYLDLIHSTIDALSAGGQGNQFNAIEQAREQGRKQDELIGAIDNLSDTFKEKQDELEDPNDKEGLLGKISGIYDSFMLSLLAVKGFLVGAGSKILSVGKVLFKSVGRFAGPIGIAIAAFEFFSGAFEGWGNAAEKLGKDMEDVTTTDKIASAIGGGLGKLTSIVDSIAGLFGFETNVQEFVDQKVTELLATFLDKITGLVTRVKDFFMNIFDITFPEGFSLTALVDAPYNLLKGWWETLLNVELPDFSLVEFIQNGITFLKDKITELFNFGSVIPEGFSISEIFSDFFQNIKDFFQESVIPEEFSITEILSGFFQKIKDFFQDFNPLDMIKESVFGKSDEPGMLDKAKGKISSLFGGGDDIQEVPTKKVQMNEESTKGLYQASIDQEQKTNMPAPQLISSHNSTRNVSNVSNSTIQQTHMSPRDVDHSIRLTSPREAAY